MITIENNYLKVRVSELGGEIKSIFDKNNNRELLYDGSGFWKCTDHILFPFIGPDSSYKIEGKEYSCPTQHGFVRTSLIKAERIFKDKAIMYLESDPETLKIYPYEFRLTIEYSLKVRSLIRKYVIKSTSGKEMPFMIGDHPAYRVDFSKAEFHFNRPNIKYLPRPNFILQSPIDFISDNKYRPSKNDFRRYETIVLKNDDLTLDLDTGSGTDIYFHLTSPYIAIWSSPDEGDNYICVEPWWGLPPYKDMPEEIKDRKAINKTDGELSFSSQIDFN